MSEELERLRKKYYDASQQLTELKNEIQRLILSQRTGNGLNEVLFLEYMSYEECDDITFDHNNMVVSIAAARYVFDEDWVRAFYGDTYELKCDEYKCNDTHSWYSYFLTPKMSE